VLLPGYIGGMEMRLSDGKRKSLSPGIGNPQGVWYDDASRRAVWIKRQELDIFKARLIIAAGTLPHFDMKGPNSVRENWATTHLTPAELVIDEIDGLLGPRAVSPDLSRLAVATKQADGHSLVLFRIEHGEKLKLTEIARVSGTHLSPIERIQFSPNGKVLATGSGESSFYLWDVDKAGKDWKPRATNPGGNFRTAAFAFSPDGRTLAAATLDVRGRDNLFMIDVPSGKLVSARRLEKPANSLAYSPDGQTLVTGHFLGMIRLWNAAAIRGD
jgi:dipeptidyl aminopeptidase/acylaminoacyl peptidase